MKMARLGLFAALTLRAVAALRCLASLGSPPRPTGSKANRHYSLLVNVPAVSLTKSHNDPKATFLF